MLLRRKLSVLPIIACLAIFGLAFTFSPVHADGGDTPPVTEAVVVTEPENPGEESGEVDQVGTPPEESPAPSESGGTEPTEEPVVPETTPEPTEEPVTPTATPEPTEEPEIPAATPDPTEEPVTPAVTPVSSGLENNSDDTSEGTEPQVVAQTQITETPTVTNPELLTPEEPLPAEGDNAVLGDGVLSPTEIPPLEDPGLVVLDENGNALPLGSEEANEVMAEADPYFYVGTTKYSFTATSCGPGGGTCDNPLQAAFDYIRDNNLNPTGGAVYAEPDTYTSLVIDGATWTTVPASISLIGVTDGYKNVGSPDDHILGYLSVANFKSFMIKAFSIIGNLPVNEAVATFDNNTGTLTLINVVIRNEGAGDGLVVTSHSGNIGLGMVDANNSGGDGLNLEVVSNSGFISLTWVDASDNGGRGAIIKNKASPVTITNSSFDDNGLKNLDIQSDGAVTVNGISASYSASGDGAEIKSKGLALNQAIFNGNAGYGLQVGDHDLGGVTTIQNSQFNDNGIAGLVVRQNGNVTLTNVRASGNASTGAYIDTCGYDLISETCTNRFTGNVTISKSTFTNNATDEGSGLGVYAKGIINVTDVYSGWNGRYSNGDPGSNNAIGAELSTTLDVKPWAINITNSTFDNNTFFGLSALSKGIITIKDTSASNNSANGLYLDNDGIGVKAGINVLNSTGIVNVFNNNGDVGLQVNSNGPVVIKAVKAEGNGAAGIYVDNANGTGTVMIDGVSGGMVNNNGWDGIWDGIHVVSKGMITVKNTDASGNGGYGYYLDNQAGSNAGVSVLATLPRWYNGLDGNGNDGLRILSKGAVIVQKTKANNSGHYGAYIDNSQGTGTVTITDSQFNDNANVSVDPLVEYGLYVLSRGSITLTTVQASDAGYNDEDDDLNDVYGSNAYLDNSTALTPAAVSITKGTFDNAFGHNVLGGGNGLEVNSKGAITFKTGSANNNLQSAATLNNSTSAANQAVTVDAVNMYGNRYGETGLTVLSKGNITVKASEISSYNGDAINLNNTYGTGTVTISGDAGWKRYLGNNGGDAITINTRGNVALSHLVLNDNDGCGADITTTGNTSTVTLTNIDFYNNNSYGLKVLANGNITLDNVVIADNHSYGANLQNSSGKGTVTVKSSTGQQIRNNTGYGLQVISKGNITLTNIEIYQNGEFGAWLSNSGGSTATVTINSNRYTNWSQNGQYALKIDSPGAVTVNWVDAYDSGTYGADINNTYAAGTATPAVTITNSWFNNSHGGSGLDVNSKGNITLTNVDANNSNGGHGAYLNNLLGKGTVTITGPNAEEFNSYDSNTDYGLTVLSNGAITMKFVSANNNANYGANIDNSTAATPLAVTITTGDFSNNASTSGDYGLNVLSKGAITMFEVWGNGNGNWDTFKPANGMQIDNCSTNGSTCMGNGLVSITSSGGWWNVGYGMDIKSTGEIKLSDVSAGNNFLYGGKFDNAVTRDNPNPALPDIKSTAGVTLALPAGYSSNWGYFTDNGEYGFMITSNGAVKVSNVRVLNNNLSGTQDYAALIDNTTASTPMAVTVTNSTFSDNPVISGIIVNSVGAITFSNNLVNGNSGLYDDGQYAAILDNHTSALPQTVTVKASKFIGNSSGTGLNVVTKGNVLLSDLDASGNGQDGLNVDSTYGTGTVTINGKRNTFNGNAREGASILANGKVTITNIEAEYNTSGSGLAVDTYDYGTDGKGEVLITNANLNHNGLFGVRAFANGKITMTNVTAMSNGSASATNNAGAYLITNNKDIAINKSAFTGNRGQGIRSDTGPGNTMWLTGTSFYGNDTDKSGDANLTFTGTVFMK